jgi:hypothetical protein
MLKTTFKFLVLLSFLFTIPIAAQPGIKGGLAISALQASGEDYTPFLGYEVSWLQYGTSNPVFGIQIGVFYNFNFSDNFSFQPELYFVQRGYQFDQTPLYDANYSLHINYLELPLLIEYHLPLNWGFNSIIIAGPFTSLTLNSNKRIRIAKEETEGNVTGVNNFDYGIVLGLATEFAAGEGELIFDLRINWGFANVLSQPDNFTSLYNDPGTVKSRAVTLLTGYRFNIGW